MCPPLAETRISYLTCSVQERGTKKKKTSLATAPIGGCCANVHKASHQNLCFGWRKSRPLVGKSLLLNFSVCSWKVEKTTNMTRGNKKRRRHRNAAFTEKAEQKGPKQDPGRQHTRIMSHGCSKKDLRGSSASRSLSKCVRVVNIKYSVAGCVHQLVAHALRSLLAPLSSRTLSCTEQVAKTTTNLYQAPNSAGKNFSPGESCTGEFSCTWPSVKVEGVNRKQTCHLHSALQVSRFWEETVGTWSSRADRQICKGFVGAKTEKTLEWSNGCPSTPWDYV